MITIIKSSHSVEYISLNNDSIHFYERTVDDMEVINNYTIKKRCINENMMLKTFRLINKCLEDKVNKYEKDITISMELNSETQNKINYTRELDDIIVDILAFTKCMYCVRDNKYIMESDLNNISSILDLLVTFKTHVVTSPQLRLVIR